MWDALQVPLAFVFVVAAGMYRLGLLDRWLDPRLHLRPGQPRYRLPEEQVDAEFPARHRNEARAILDAVATYVPPAQRHTVQFRLLREARGNVRRLSDAAVRELAVLPDGTRIPAPLQAGGR